MSAIAAALVLGLAGCSNLYPPPPPPPPVPGAPDYLVYVDSTDRTGRSVTRQIICTVTGRGAGPEPVEVVHERTGRRGPYIVEFDSHTPARIEIVSYPQVITLVVVCTLIAERGDEISCEFLYGDDRRTAPMIGDISYAQAHFVVELNHYIASCAAIINALG